jgi:uncharacterized protein YjdB
MMSKSGIDKKSQDLKARRLPISTSSSRARHGVIALVVVGALAGIAVKVWQRGLTREGSSEGPTAQPADRLAAQIAAPTLGPAAVAAIQITPVQVTLGVGQAQPLTALGALTDSSTENLTERVAWSSSAEAVAVVDGEGVVKAIAPGEATISAAVAGVVSQTTVRVDQR